MADEYREFLHLYTTCYFKHATPLKKFPRVLYLRGEVDRATRTMLFEQFNPSRLGNPATETRLTWLNVQEALAHRQLQVIIPDSRYVWTKTEAPTGVYSQLSPNRQYRKGYSQETAEVRGIIKASAVNDFAVVAASWDNALPSFRACEEMAHNNEAGLRFPFTRHLALVMKRGSWAPVLLYRDRPVGAYDKKKDTIYVKHDFAPLADELKRNCTARIHVADDRGRISE